jgi:AmmeMemoRadiSam system protein B
MKIRHPTQAGVFYAGTAESLKKQISKCFLHHLGPGTDPKVIKNGTRQIVGLISPHAGYMFSGPVAAHAYHALASDGVPDVIVLLGPNHTGHGSALAVVNKGYWRTPLGDVRIDNELANDLVNESGIIDVNDSAHRFEHSIETQIPFLQYLYGSMFRIVPICFLLQDLLSAKEVGLALAKILSGKNALIIASSDMTHYEPQKTAEKKDKLAIKAIENMDEIKLHSIIETHHISACGYGPIFSLITAAKKMGVKKATLLSYQTSGDINGNYASVVGYASMYFKK